MFLFAVNIPHLLFCLVFIVKFVSSFFKDLSLRFPRRLNSRYDDIVVGAPFYFSKDHGGAIYIFYNLRNCTRIPDVLDVHCTNQTLYGQLESRFGFSMTALGDINKDGYNDLAVGAPYESGGAIYIYLGSRHGLNPKHSQVRLAV